MVLPSLSRQFLVIMDKWIMFWYWLANIRFFAFGTFAFCYCVKGGTSNVRIELRMYV